MRELWPPIVRNGCASGDRKCLKLGLWLESTTERTEAGQAVALESSHVVTYIGFVFQ